MPEPFKNQFSKKLIVGMGDHFSRAWPSFDKAGFVSKAAKNLRALELKERSTQITEAMAAFLPRDYKKAAAIMLKSLAPEDACNGIGDGDGDGGGEKANRPGIDGWGIMPMNHYVGLYGLEHFDLSLDLLREMTKRWTSEFGIRFFLLDDPDRTLSTLKKWIRDPSEHVRRLVSEGTRPRLPWAMQLPTFIDDPSPLLPLLEALKDDEEEYVRRSVANHLNDIAKDHPALVAKMAKKWMRGATVNRGRLVRHACRTLIKQGHKETLAALGYKKPSVRVKRLKILTPKVQFGEALLFELSLASTSKRSQPLIVDYAIHHRKANGSTSPKVFKWKTITLDTEEAHNAKRKHPMRKITTRVYYPGRHRLEILVNGVSLGSKEFELVM